MGGFVTLRRHGFPFLERLLSDRFGSLPLTDAFRPADFGSLIPGISYGVIGNRVEPAFLLGEGENMIINPIFQTKRQRPDLRRSRRQLGVSCFSLSRNPGTRSLRIVTSQSGIRFSASKIERAHRLNSCQSMY